MGERAVAGVRADGSWVLYTAQWGGADRVIARVLAAGTAGRDPTRESAVGPDRLGVLASLAWRPAETVTGALVEAVDYLETAAVYVIGSATTVWQPLWLGFPIAESSPSSADGVLTRVSSVVALRERRRALRRIKGLLGPAVAAGRLSPMIARWLAVGALPTGTVRYPTALETGSF